MSANEYRIAYDYPLRMMKARKRIKELEAELRRSNEAANEVEELRAALVSWHGAYKKLVEERDQDIAGIKQRAKELGEMLVEAKKEIERLSGLVPDDKAPAPISKRLDGTPDIHDTYAGDLSRSVATSASRPRKRKANPGLAILTKAIARLMREAMKEPVVVELLRAKLTENPWPFRMFDQRLAYAEAQGLIEIKPDGVVEVTESGLKWLESRAAKSRPKKGSL